MNPFSVIIKPIVSEKSTLLRENEGKYTFQVRREANKLDVKKAIEAMYEVKVDSVQTNITRGKYRRRGMYYFKRPNVKKAVVSLKDGAKLPLFEEQ